MGKQYLEAGLFVATQGILGELRLYPWCDSPAFLEGFKTFYLDEKGAMSITALSVRPHKNLCIVQISGVDSIEDARLLIGKTVYIDREDVHLPKGSFFVQDLLGARVVDVDTGEEYGIVEEITHPGRHDVYEVRRSEEQTTLFPAVEPFLVSVDTEKGLVQVRPIEGMFEAILSPKQKKKRGKQGDMHDSN